MHRWLYSSARKAPKSDFAYPPAPQNRSSPAMCLSEESICSAEGLPRCWHAHRGLCAVPSLTRCAFCLGYLVAHRFANRNKGLFLQEIVYSRFKILCVRWIYSCPCFSFPTRLLNGCKAGLLQIDLSLEFFQPGRCLLLAPFASVSFLLA